MRRYTFYLAVALLAFGIGFCVVYIYTLRNAETISEPVNWANNEVIQTTPLSQNQKEIVAFVKEKLNCQDEAVKTVWKKLEKEKDFVEWSNYVIEANIINNCQEVFERQTVDLNNDESDEIILKGTRPFFCGSGGDCQTWIVSKINNEYRIIFDAVAGEDSDGLQFPNKETHKFNDIKVKRYHGFASDNMGFFEFDGKQYRIKKCFEDVNSNYDYEDIYPEKWISVKLSLCL